jgi:hypothetical protein
MLIWVLERDANVGMTGWQGITSSGMLETPRLSVSTCPGWHGIKSMPGESGIVLYRCGTT